MKGITALAFVFGLAALYGVDASEAADGAAKVADGKPVFLKYKCGSCHSIEAQGITRKALAGEAGGAGSKPPDLSGVGVDRKADWIAAFLLKKEKLGNTLHMKKFRGSDAELQKLATWLATLKDEAASKKMKAVEEQNEAGQKSGTKSDK